VSVPELVNGKGKRHGVPVLDLKKSKGRVVATNCRFQKKNK